MYWAQVTAGKPTILAKAFRDLLQFLQSGAELVRQLNRDSLFVHISVIRRYVV
jgi:hypothetical protein